MGDITASAQFFEYVIQTHSHIQTPPSTHSLETESESLHLSGLSTFISYGSL